MSTRSLRNRVSSRLSSPLNTAEQDGQEAAEETDDGRDRRMGNDEWVEPPVRKLPPSFQDHKGLERVGVLELQQPLGELPSQKLLQRLKLNHRSLNRSTPLQSEEAVTPSVESERPDFPSPQETEVPTEQPHDPQPAEAIPISSPPRGRPAKKDAAEMRQSGASAFAFEITPSPVKSTFSNTSPHKSNSQVSKPASIQEHLRQDRVLNYVDRAIREAEQNGDLGLVPGLDRIRNDAFVKRDLWTVLDAIAHQEPTEEHLKVFKRFIKKGVKRHRREVLNSGSQNTPATNSISPRPTNGTGEPAPSQSPTAPATFVSPFRTKPSSHQPPRSAQKRKVTSPSSKGLNMSKTDEHSPRRKSRTRSGKKRSGSQSSSSSLSSAKSFLEDFPVVSEVDAEAEGADERSLGNGGQRQASDRNLAGGRLRSSATNHSDAKHISSAFNDVAKLTNKRVKKSKDEVDHDPAEIDRLRKRFQADSFHDYNYIKRKEVDDRTHVLFNEDDFDSATDNNIVPPPVIHAHPIQPLSGSRSMTKRGQTLPQLDLPNGNSRKRRFDEMEEYDDLDIPTPLSASPETDYMPLPPLSPPHRLASRAVTPRAAKIPAINKARKSARVMVSPNKPKNGGITAGISRAGPTRESAIGNGVDSSAEDNDEYCSACGGEGKLLCCDGCVRSFHHSCLEPPLDPDEEVDGEWFCPQCMAKRKKDSPETAGLLGKILRRVDDIIPKAFTLPTEIREYFDGVRTGDEGEYEEFGQPATQIAPKMNRAGFFEEPNYKESRDNKGKLITCYKCGLSTNGRDIIPCSFCPAKWHLDCCDPPLAVPPRRRNGDKPGATWRCPLHVDQDLVGLGRQAEAAPGDLGRSPRLRKPKNATPVDVSLPRGFRNNGVIEVELMKDDMPATKEINMGGTMHRIPEKGLRLDFIDRVKKSWFEDQTFPALAGRPRGMQDRLYRPTSGPQHHPSSYVRFKMDEPDFFAGSQAMAIAETAKANAALRRKSFAEQQAILSLASLAQKSKGYSGDNIADLTNQLIVDAPPTADDAIQRGEKESLQRLKQLIDKRLRILDGIETSPPSTTYPTPQPAPRPLRSKPPVQTSYFPPAARYQLIAPSPPERTPSMGSNGHSYTPLAPAPVPQATTSGTTTPSATATSPVAMAQTTQDSAIDPRLFNGDFVEDEGNDGDVEMDNGSS